MILSATVFLAIPVFIFLTRKYQREFYEKHRGEIRMIPALFCSGLYLAALAEKSRKLSPEEQEMREVFLLSEDAERIAAAKRFSGMLLIGLAASAGTFLLFLLPGQDTEIHAVRRPEFGEERQVELRADSKEGEIPVRFSISGRDPGEDEYEEVFDRAYAELLREILNENTDFSELRTDLKLPKETPEGIRVTYSSSQPGILSDDGMILAEKIPEEGESLFLAVSLQYGGFEKNYVREIRVLPPEEPEKSLSEQIRELILEAERESKDQEIVSLPDEYAGEAIRFYPSRLSPYLLFAAAAVLALWMCIFPGERMKEKLKKRKHALQEAYPGFVMRLAVLLRAGLSTRSAFVRMLRDFEAESSRRKDPLYEELTLALRNMEHGMPEEEAYLQFGRRCGLSSYRRLGNFLARNLRYGLSGAQAVLDGEVEKALELKRNNALRRGEEAGTKLLFPMVLLFVVVLILIVVPAFMMLN